MEEAKASWNTRFVTSQGFDCQITLRDDDEKELVKRAAEVLQGILTRGGKPTVSNWKGNAPVKEGESHFCSKHKVAMFKRGKMKDYAHPVNLESGDTGWCDGKETRIAAPHRDQG